MKQLETKIYKWNKEQKQNITRLGWTRGENSPRKVYLKLSKETREILFDNVQNYIDIGKRRRGYFRDFLGGIYPQTFGDLYLFSDIAINFVLENTKRDMSEYYRILKDTEKQFPQKSDLEIKVISVHEFFDSYGAISTERFSGNDPLIGWELIRFIYSVIPLSEYMQGIIEQKKSKNRRNSDERRKASGKI